MAENSKHSAEQPSTEATADFYKTLSRDDFDSEVIKREDDINQKSTGFHIFKAIRKIYSNKELGTVIDVGGNYGIFLKMLSEEFVVKRKVCLDIAEPPVRIKDIEYLIGFAEETLKRLNENSVDLVLLQDVIEHIFDPDRLILNLKYVLKDGGVIILSTPNLSSFINRILLLFGFEPMGVEVSTKTVFGRPGSSVAGHIRNFTYRALRDFFEYYGFNVEVQYTYASYLSKGSSKLSKLIHWIDKGSVIFGKKYRSQIFLIAKK